MPWPTLTIQKMVVLDESPGDRREVFQDRRAPVGQGNAYAETGRRHARNQGALKSIFLTKQVRRCRFFVLVQFAVNKVDVFRAAAEVMPADRRLSVEVAWIRTNVVQVTLYTACPPMPSGRRSSRSAQHLCPRPGAFSVTPKVRRSRVASGVGNELLSVNQVSVR